MCFEDMGAEEIYRMRASAKSTRGVPDIIYIPYNPDNAELMTVRKRLRDEFISLGWRLLGSCKIRDDMGSETCIWIGEVM